VVELSIQSGLEQVINAHFDEVMLSREDSLSNEESEEQCVLDADDGAGAGDTAELHTM
jgi:hypothetical protein